MKLERWHFIAGGVGLAVVGVGVWYFVYRITEAEQPPENTVPVNDPTLKPGTTTGYVKGVASPITLSPVGNNQFMRSDAAAQFLAMQAAAKSYNIALSATSGFRTMESQQRLYEGYRRKLSGDPTAANFNMAAKPGFSNHQGGISVDVGGVGSFTSAAYRWLALNASRYGFKNDVSTEYWHWTFTPNATGISGLAGIKARA